MAIKQYLDLEGLDILWSKIKEADQVNSDAIAALQSKLDEVETAANDAYDLANNTQSYLGSIEEDITDLDSRLTSQAGDIANLQSRIESVVPDEIVYAEVSKDSNGNYVTSRGDRSALSSTVVTALNELNESLKSVNFSDYYNKNEADDIFVKVDNIFSENEILEIFNN